MARPTAPKETAASTEAISSWSFADHHRDAKVLDPYTLAEKIGQRAGTVPNNRISPLQAADQTAHKALVALVQLLARQAAAKAVRSKASPAANAELGALP